MEQFVPGLNVLTTIQSVTSLIVIPLLLVIALLLITFFSMLKKDIRNKELYVDDSKRIKWE